MAAQTGGYLIAIVPGGVLFKICWWGWNYSVLNIIATSIIGTVFFSHGGVMTGIGASLRIKIGSELLPLNPLAGAIE